MLHTNRKHIVTCASSQLSLAVRWPSKAVASLFGLERFVLYAHLSRAAATGCSRGRQPTVLAGKIIEAPQGNAVKEFCAGKTEVCIDRSS